MLDDASFAGDAKAGLLALAGDYRARSASVMPVIYDHIDQLVARLRFPLEHRKRTRSTNLLARTFVEVRRRPTPRSSRRTGPLGIWDATQRLHDIAGSSASIANDGGCGRGCPSIRARETDRRPIGGVPQGEPRRALRLHLSAFWLPRSRECPTRPAR